MLTLIISSLAAAFAGYLIYRWRRRVKQRSLSPSLSQQPSQQTSEDERRRREEREQRQEKERQRQQEQEEERQCRRAEEKKREEEKAQRENEQIADIIHRMVDSVRFTAKCEWVGRIKVAERAVGVDHVEVPYVADDIEIRPLTDPSEIGLLLPTETAADDDIFYARIAAGESLVAAATEVRIRREDVFKNQWRERQRILYVLLDVSPSMFPHKDVPDGYWRPRVWRSLACALVDHVQAHEALFLSRLFSGTVQDQKQASTPAQATVIKDIFQSVGSNSHTNIPLALHTAVQDFEHEHYDQAQIVIITDGENNTGIDVSAVRKTLADRKIQLHALLLGANNEALRACSDRYQIVTYDPHGGFVLHDLHQTS